MKPAGVRPRRRTLSQKMAGNEMRPQERTLESSVALWVRFVLFFGLLVVALGAMSWYLHRRTSQAFRLGRRGKWALALLLVAGIVLTAIGRGAGRMISEGAAEVLAVVGSTVLLAVIISVALLLLVDVARMSILLARKLPRGRRRPAETTADTPPPPAIPVTRRDFIQQGTTSAALLVGVSTSTYGALFGRHDYTIEEVPLRIPGLSRALEGYTIVQLSDIHFGTFVGEPELRSAVEHVQRARPDLIVLTGDLVDHDPAYAPLLSLLVSRLTPLARDGVAAIPGNHDYYAGVETVLTSLRDGGATVLRNQGRVVGDRGGAFALLGVDDVWAPRNGFDQAPDLERAIAMVPPELPRVLLCHNPVFFPEAADRVQLQLSGHTHGGQVNVGVRLADHVLPFGYVAGTYERGAAQLYVNRGFGTAGPPARIGAPPEITKLVLLSA